ncbi:hypothetical protein HPB51_010353 [Rhipicephalus microplus]|uniref:Uncharacterized protein n=1 Tax=Rhipicephalus microplus TaxID=6941 RepID=A0A9J6E8Z3_RHIMP|nr:hypothetical protein HPB51_010353 [Rhipicephalus microplus]
MAGGAVGAGGTEESLEQDADGHVKLKVICLGDSAVGKSNKPHQASTYALTLLRHKTKVDGEPVIVADSTVVQKSFNFGKKNGMPFYFVSASDGTNVVKMFRDAISAAYRYRKDPTDFIDQVLQELEVCESSAIFQQQEAPSTAKHRRKGLEGSGDAKKPRSSAGVVVLEGSESLEPSESVVEQDDSEQVVDVKLLDKRGELGNRVIAEELGPPEDWMEQMSP